MALPSHHTDTGLACPSLPEDRTVMASDSPWEGWGAGGVCVWTLLDQVSTSAGCRSRAQQVPANPQQLQLCEGTAGVSLQRGDGGGSPFPLPDCISRIPALIPAWAYTAQCGGLREQRSPLCAEEESARQECPGGGFGGNWAVGRARGRCWGWSRLLWQRKELRTRVRAFTVVVDPWNRGEALVGLLPKGDPPQNLWGCAQAILSAPTCLHLSGPAAATCAQQ